MAQTVRTALKVIVVWLVLSAPLALLVAPAIKARLGRPGHGEPWAPQAPREPVRPVQTVRPVHGAPRALPDRPVPRAHRAR
jgi:hypothetical protein